MARLAAECGHLDDPPPKGLSERCSLPTDLQRVDDYQYRLRLPVLRAQTAAAPTGVPTDAQTKDAIVEQYVRSVSRRRCVHDVGDPGCLLESQIAALRASLDQMEGQAPQAPAR
jgi:hypothetical protein